VGERPETNAPVGVGLRAARGAPWLAAAAWVNRAALAFVLLALASSLSVREFGLVSVALFMSNLLMVLKDVGFAPALIYQRDRVREAAETVLFVTITGGALLGVALFVSASLISSFFRVPDAADVLRAYGGMVALNAVSVGPLALLSRSFSFRRRFVVESIPAVVGSALTIVLVLFGVGVWSLVIGDAVRYALVVVLALTLVEERLLPRWHRDVAGELWRYARAASVAAGIDFALLNVDYALVARLLGPVALGYYALAFRVSILPFYLVTMVAIGASWPAFARLMPDVGRVLSAFRATVRVTSAFTFLIAGGIVTLAPSLQILGARWEPAVATAQLLAVFVCLRSGAYLIEALFQAAGRPGINAVLRGAWTIALALLIVVIGREGIVVVGAAQVGVATALVLAHLFVGRRLVGLDVGGFLDDFGRPAVVAVVSGLVVVGVRMAFGGWIGDPTSWLSVVVLALVFSAAFVAVLRLIAPSTVADAGSVVAAFRGRRLERASPVTA